MSSFRRSSALLAISRSRIELDRTRSICCCGVRPSTVSSRTRRPTCCLRPPMRFMKNSSSVRADDGEELEPEIPQASLAKCRSAPYLDPCGRSPRGRGRPRDPMALPSDILLRSAEEAARRIALEFLAEAHAASRRLDDSEDAEALHDFRVAVRRLRSTTRAWRAELRKSISKRHRRALRASRPRPGADAMPRWRSSGSPTSARSCAASSAVASSG